MDTAEMMRDYIAASSVSPGMLVEDHRTNSHVFHITDSEGDQFRVEITHILSHCVTCGKPLPPPGSRI